ncbi:MAG: AtpZ/AtpI family protein [Anaerolineales bacterium]
MSDQNDQGKNRLQYALNLTVIGIFGQVGCLTLVIIVLALFGGLWLDGLFDTKPLFTIILMVGSVPVTLFLMFWTVTWATRRIKPINNSKATETSSQEETNRD